MDEKSVSLHFFVEKKPNGNSNYFDSHKSPTVFPSFVLVYNKGWNDYRVQTEFDVFLYKNSTEQPIHIGSVKILNIYEFKKEELENKYYEVIDYLPDNFEGLSNDFCSLGQTQDYYDNIKKEFPSEYNKIFEALRDCSIYPKIEDDFFKHKQFHSLIRFDEAERILREEKYILAGQNIKSKYQFTYKFTPKYTVGSIDINFNFHNRDFFADRLYAIIGKNGVGKTQFITSLPMDIAKKNSDCFIPHVPIFSKVIAISNSYFDNFEIPTNTLLFNYIYCGLSKLEKGKREPITLLGFKQRLNNACKQIIKKERVSSLKKILSNILEFHDISDLFNTNEENNESINLEKISSIFATLSSGQSALMYILCEVIANIRYDTLILFDEPETHLHPNAISSLMNALYQLLEEFQSYCIISTHSPLIVREVLGRNVYVLERDKDYASIRKVASDSFGENLTQLSEEIFGNKEVQKYYQEQIRYFVKQGLSYEKIVGLLKTNDIPLSLNITLFIKNIFENKNEKY
ncbi:MAG: AAA family ATPase [Endomicrobiaceae bacterium]|nr:AAA family ATPase [Endomicrobiaceae bacterium]